MVWHVPTSVLAANWDSWPSLACGGAFFLSDPANQIPLLKAEAIADEEADCAISFIGQAPLTGTKINLIAHHLRSSKPLQKQRTGATLQLQRGKQTHLWITDLEEDSTRDAHAQTRRIFADYAEGLSRVGGTLSDAAVRTWIYVRGIDMNYGGMVRARGELFQDAGLTPDTHYIASTGIEARFSNINGKVKMDTYSIAPLTNGQVDYVNAFDHLGRTDDYGVNFERATAIHYRDRSHVFVSGTASINPAGEIVHAGDVLAQFERALENVEALLRSVDGDLDSMAHWILYLRDPADAARIRARAEQRMKSVPYVLVIGAVCRPGWLIEVEGLAIMPGDRPELPEY